MHNPREIKSKADKLTYILDYVNEFQQQKERTPEQPYLHHSQTPFQFFLASGTYCLATVDLVSNVLAPAPNQLM